MALTPQQIAEMDAIAGVKIPTPVNADASLGMSRAQAIRDRVKAATSQTGLKLAPLQATGNENITQGVGKAIGNAPRSAFELGKNIVSAITHPKRTVTALADIAEGAGGKLGEVILEDTRIGNKLLEKINEEKKRQGLSEFKRNEEGKLTIDGYETPELQKFDQVLEFFNDRYGSKEKFKETAIEDPVGVLADIASLISGTGAGIKAVGTTGKISEIANMGSKIVRFGDAIEPITVTTKTTGGAFSALKNSKLGQAAGTIISDVTPTADKIQSGQVVKALDLTPGDISNIQKATGNDVTRFIVDNDLIKATPEEIAQALRDKKSTTMKQVRDEIRKVTNKYSAEQIPRMRDGLGVILEDVQNIPGLESAAAEIRNLMNKIDYDLSDVQRAKELLDENANIYSKFGDVKSASKAKGLDNIRKELRKFIEDEVDTASNGQTNIRQLNNDVSTSKAIEDAINNRASKGMSRQHISALDLMIGLGGTAAFSPLAGLGIVIAKKVAESPAFRLLLTKALQKKPIKFVKNFIEEFNKNNVSENTRQQIQEMVDSARSNLQYLESGANILDEENDK